MRTFASLLVGVGLVGLAACAQSAAPGVAPTAEPLTLTISTPTRGTTVDGSSVAVSGQVAGGTGAVTVTVSGTATPVGADGSFSAALPVADGIDVIQTVAVDSANDTVRDVRAVLAGPLAAADGTDAAPIATHADATALAALGSAMATDAAAVDYTSVAESLNPIYNNTGCLGAVVNITNVSLSGVDVSLAPGSGALAVNVTLNDVSVTAHVSFEVACISGSGTITITASAAHVTGGLAAAVANGALATSLPTTQVTLDNFNLSVSDIPSEVTGLFSDIIQGKVETALGNAIQSKVPAIANAKLAGLLAQPVSETLFGHAITVGVTPTAATVDSTGVYVSVATSLTVAGGSGGMFLTEPTTSAQPLLATVPGLGVAVANDVVNQLFAGLWAAGALDQTVQLSSIPVLGTFLDPNATQIALSLSLPPTAATDPDGNLDLAIGDAMLSVQNAAGSELQRVALSVQSGVAVSNGSGALSLTLGTPTVYAQVIVQADDGTAALSATELQGIVTGAWSLVGTEATTALGKLPLPDLAGVQLGDPSVDSSANYVVATIPLQ